MEPSLRLYANLYVKLEIGALKSKISRIFTYALPFFLNYQGFSLKNRLLTQFEDLISPS